MHPNRRTSPDWLSVQEVADRYGISSKTVRRLIARGELPASTLRGSRVLRVATVDVDRLLRPVPAPGR
jgi:excisionase family DNA binding protein